MLTPGLAGGGFVEAPKVANGSLIGWHTQIWPWRKYAIDMAGFAVNLDEIVKNPT